MSVQEPITISGISKLSREDRDVLLTAYINQMTHSDTRKGMRAEMKGIFREAINDFLKEKYAEVGKWTVRGIAAGALSLLTYLILHMEGWRLIK
jgi:hypothetical protein